MFGLFNGRRRLFYPKLIAINVKEGDDDFELTAEMKTILEKRLQEDENTYLSAKDPIDQLNKKYG